ncbi:heavy-metal-associated domain-containing protein [Oscillospiraceae bacterium MB08-C2-2]|nr:heavy-metal-associated domain-containing protein [Oscillospiraceae bacterium MB08-C2-2]
MKKTFKLVGLDCANCAAKMEHAISKLPDVHNVTINFMTTKMAIEAADEKMEAVLSSATDIIKKLEPQIEIKKA